MSDAPLVAKKSFSDGCVQVGIKLKAGGWGHDRAQIVASTDITTAQARALAQALVALADEADARVVRKVAAEERRKNWRDREIAAGRMKVFGT